MTKQISLKLLPILLLISLAWSLPAGAAPAEPQVAVYHQGSVGSAQFELLTPKGVRIFIDVYDHSLLTSPATARDILLTTHMHGDHVDDTFFPNFPGEQIQNKPAKLIRDDVVITSIPTSHSTLYGPINPQNATNHIFLIETGGLRIVHLGGFGQDQFLPEQLALLGKVDLVMAPFQGFESGMNFANKKGFNLMQQLQPRLIVPTHISLETAKHMPTLWKCYYAESPLQLKRSTLSDDTRLLFLGEPGRAFVKILNLPTAPF